MKCIYLKIIFIWNVFEYLLKCIYHLCEAPFSSTIPDIAVWILQVKKNSAFKICYNLPFCKLWTTFLLLFVMVEKSCSNIILLTSPFDFYFQSNGTGFSRNTYCMVSHFYSVSHHILTVSCSSFKLQSLVYLVCIFQVLHCI